MFIRTFCGFLIAIIQNNNYLTIFYIPALIIFLSAMVLRKESIAV